MGESTVSCTPPPTHFFSPFDRSRSLYYSGFDFNFICESSPSPVSSPSSNDSVDSLCFDDWILDDEDNGKATRYI